MSNSGAPNGNAKFAIRINGEDLDVRFPVIFMETRQTAKDKFSARFSVPADDLNAYAKPAHCDMGNTVEIMLGYDDDVRPVFYGKIENIVLESLPGIANYFVYTFSCLGNTALAASNNYVEVELGVNVAAINIEEKNGLAAGSVTVRGSSEAWIEGPVDLRKLPLGLSVEPVTGVMHTIKEGRWLTTIHIGQQTDSAQEKIVLQTKKGNSIVLDDTTNSIVMKDANGNEISLTDGVVKISGAKDVSISAQWNMNINSGGANITANDDMTLRASKIHLN